MTASCCFLVAVLLVSQAGPTSAAEGSPVAFLSRCVVAMIDRVELPAQEQGVLTSLATREGAAVQKGALLAAVDETLSQIKKKAAQYRLDVAQEKATNDAEVQVARKIIELAKAEYEESVAINARVPGSIPEQQMRRQRVQWEKAVLDAVAADMNFKVAGLEQKVAEAEVEAADIELQRRMLKAPFDGVVVTIFKHESEWVQPGDAVLYIVRMDRLRVEGFLNAAEHAPEEAEGARVEVAAQLAGGEQAAFQGTIDYVSPVLEANGDYRVWAEVENRAGAGGSHWLLRPGSEVEMRIFLNPRGAVARPAG